MTMPWERALSALRSEVDRRLDALRGLVEFVTLDKHTADGAEDAAKAGAGSDEKRPLRRVEPFGFASRPPEGLLGAIIKAFGGASSGILVGVAGARYRPAGLATGDSVQYSTADGARVKVGATGKVEIDAAAGQDVVLNGGLLKVARDTDPTVNGTLTAVVGQAGPTVTVTVSYTPPGGVLTPWFAFSATGTGTPGTYTASLAGKISGGAANVKG